MLSYKIKNIIIIRKCHIKYIYIYPTNANLNFKIPETIPYDNNISNNPKKKMKKGEERKWLRMIESHMKDFNCSIKNLE